MRKLRSAKVSVDDGVELLRQGEGLGAFDFVCQRPDGGQREGGGGERGPEQRYAVLLPPGGAALVMNRLFLGPGLGAAVEGDGDQTMARHCMIT
jgi:hypothetical protein